MERVDSDKKNLLTKNLRKNIVFFTALFPWKQKKTVELVRKKIYFMSALSRRCVEIDLYDGLLIFLAVQRIDAHAN